MWHVVVESVWAEFVVPGQHRPVPLLDATPLQLWLYVKPEEKEKEKVKEKGERPTRKLLSEFYGSSQEESKEEDQEPEVGLHVLALASQLVSLQLDHYQVTCSCFYLFLLLFQLLFLLRLAETLGELGAFMSADSARIVTQPQGLVVGAVLPQVEFANFSPVLISLFIQDNITILQVDLSLILDVKKEKDETDLDETMEEVSEAREEVKDMEEALEAGLQLNEPSEVDQPSPGLLVPCIGPNPLSYATESSPEVKLLEKAVVEPAGLGAESHDAPPALLSNGLPPPKIALRPTLSSNGLPPELASALDRMQTSHGLSPVQVSLEN